MTVEPVARQPLRRTLLLAPPSLAAHEAKLRDVFTEFDRSTSDLQMLDRLSIVSLPPATYDLVLLLTDKDGSRRNEVLRLLSRQACASLFESMKVGAELKSQDGQPLGIPDAKEAVLAGLVAESGGFVKPPDDAEVAVPLRLRSKSKPAAAVMAAPEKPQVVTLDLLDDLDGDDDDLIDEDSLIPDVPQPVFQSPECEPKPGKRRRACKGCTCGLAERLASKSQDAPKLVLMSEELNELDFTVQGKTGSCGNCSLGDAFRCAGCPYLGLPRFEPGEEVRILNNVAQF